MSGEAFDWLVVLTAWFVAIGVGAFVGMVVDSWMEWRRERSNNGRLPPPSCRARVVRRWGVPE